jgi:hypothetical protein
MVPGTHPLDQKEATLPPVDYQIVCLDFSIQQSIEHLSGFLNLRAKKRKSAENKLHWLISDLKDISAHFIRLEELLWAGYLPTPKPYSTLAVESEAIFYKNRGQNPLDFALKRLETIIHWAIEHTLSFINLRVTEVKLAEAELQYLIGVLNDAPESLKNLQEFLWADYRATPRPYPKFGVGQKVQILLNAEEKANRIVLVRNVLWISKEQRYKYYTRDTEEEASIVSVAEALFFKDLQA